MAGGIRQAAHSIRAHSRYPRRLAQLGLLHHLRSAAGIVLLAALSASRYGSLDAALAAAKAWRNDKATQVLPYTARESCEQLRSDNTSGVPGVALVRTRRKRADGSMTDELKWMAHMMQDGRTRTRSFSCARYGNEKAFELAVQARRQLLASVSGFRLPYTPPAFVPDEHAQLQAVDRPMPTRRRGGRGIIWPDPDEQCRSNGQS